MVEQLGIVYTPVEVVDFIIHSVNDVLKKEFGRSISDENVHILDPFTGTGTFITRLLQSGLIKQEDLKRKYANELHANEIVLLAYYIAAVNIENAYHDQIQETEEYQSFEGIVLTDTFQLGETDESEKLFSEMFPKNSERVQAQQKAPLRVIMGNPPYSIGQKSENDDAKNQEYLKLNKRIAETYVSQSSYFMKKSNYDSYIRAFRWASDRLDKVNGGVIAFVSNSGWIDSNSLDGFRKSIENEFSSIYVVNLRGAIRGRSGELAKREGKNVFDIMTGVSINILIRKPKYSGKAKIYYHDIGDYLSRKEKLKKLDNSFSENAKSLTFELIKPNKDSDWTNQRNDSFKSFITILSSKEEKEAFFNKNSNGIITSRDTWVYSFNHILLTENVGRMINHYMNQLRNYNLNIKLNPGLLINDFIDNDQKKISWSRALKAAFKRKDKRVFKEERIYKVLYRPFVKQSVYFDRDFNECVYQMPSLYPTNNSVNKHIIIPGTGERKGFAALITNNVSDLNLFDGSSQCFPLYHYVEREQIQGSLFDAASESKYIRRDGVSDFILERAKKQYGKSVTKEDIFYYVYGILHSPDYRIAFANDLKKTLPRIPLVDEPRDFWKFSKAGKALADLHINYESVPAYPGAEVSLLQNPKTVELFDFYKVHKMKFPKKDQKDKIIYNSKITIEKIPAKAFEYVVNGRSAIEWILDRYQVRIHKDSGIKNDPNDWAKEVDNPRYILDLILSVINVSVQTVDIVNGLPELKFEESTVEASV